jgi:hypothetical protein
MKIKDITRDDIRRGMNWKLSVPGGEGFPDVPLEDLPVEQTEAFQPDDYVVYTTIFVTDAGEVQPRVVIKVVGDGEYNGDSCELTARGWRQTGLEPDPNAPFGEEYFANPLDQDPSFESDHDFRQWHRDGFAQHIPRL